MGSEFVDDEIIKFEFLGNFHVPNYFAPVGRIGRRHHRRRKPNAPMSNPENKTVPTKVPPKYPKRKNYGPASARRMDVECGCTFRQLEHIGDAVFMMASRLLCLKIAKTRQELYFFFCDRFVRNAVMGGTQEEIRIGRIFLKDGSEAALRAATETLIATDDHQKLLRLASENPEDQADQAKWKPDPPPLP